MVDEPKPAPAIKYAGEAGRAPVIFFDAAPSCGGFNGIIGIALSAALQVPGNNGKTDVEHHVVAHLRTNVEGIRSLRAAIDAALLSIEPVEGKAN